MPGVAYFYRARNQTESLVQTGSSDDRRKSPVELSFQEGAGAKIKISLDFFASFFGSSQKMKWGSGQRPANKAGQMFLFCASRGAIVFHNTTKNMSSRDVDSLVRAVDSLVRADHSLDRADHSLLALHHILAAFVS